MAKQKVSAKEVTRDIRSGMSNADLMEKYQLSAKGLSSLFKKLVNLRVLAAEELRGRATSAKETADPGPSRSAGSRVPAPSPQPGLSPLEKAIVKELKEGVHRTELMRRHEISPGRLKEILEQLVAFGYLSEEEVETGKPERPQLNRCPFCSGDVLPGEVECKHCGRRLDDQQPTPPIGLAAGVRPPVPPVESAEETVDEYCVWEDREAYGTLNAFTQTAMKCLLYPSAFFSSLPVDRGYLSPILFGIVSLVVSAVFGVIWISLLGIRSIAVGIFGLFIAVAFAVIGGAIVVPIFLFLWSGILHVCLMILQGAKRGFQATFRVVAYSVVTSVFSAIPVVGSIVSLYGLYLTVVGLRETHRTTTLKAVGALCIPVGLFGILMLTLWLTAAPSPTQTAFQPAFSGEPLGEELCLVINDFVGEVDAAAELNDANATDAAVKDAMNTLNSRLADFKDHPRIMEVKQKATFFGLGSVGYIRSKEAFGGKFNISALGTKIETLRENVTSMCEE